MGTLGASLHTGGLDIPDARDRHGLLLGLLPARFGRMVVLGPRRKRLVHAMARWHRASAFGGGDGKTRSIDGVDDSVGDSRFFSFASWDIPRTLRRAYICTRVCERPAKRRVHHRHPGAADWWRARTFCLARPSIEKRWIVRADFA